ncbi:hypothetical protein [Halarchaeum nitratireducens]|uniref:Uncharacterized protein n=1 Tax=Halarchaeum nitratireducens TaxID=489913 RepID=A0A830GA20_9EURY|nr:MULTISPECIES: hypothetical protein [Halarchaeum]MBP2250623.1 hypothetical protein [Halarchaeum solikamskense]GGN15734.1 hypothetical protein GCM10009021_15180 [Halarchaeum nitratireducens]
MTLDDLVDDVQSTNRELKDADFALDRESRTELAMLVAALDPEDADELVRRAIHALFDSYVQSGKLDFALRSAYDTTYDEYLAGMSYDEMAGSRQEFPQDDDEGRRYQY